MATPFLQPHSPAFFCVRALDFFLFCSVFLGSPVGWLPRGITGTPGAGSTFQPGGNLWGERFAGFQQPEQQGEAKGAPFTLKLSNPHSRTRQTNPPDEYLLFLSVHTWWDLLRLLPASCRQNTQNRHSKSTEPPDVPTLCDTSLEGDPPADPELPLLLPCAGAHGRGGGPARRAPPADAESRWASQRQLWLIPPAPPSVLQVQGGGDLHPALHAGPQPEPARSGERALWKPAGKQQDKRFISCTFCTTSHTANKLNHLRLQYHFQFC